MAGNVKEIEILEKHLRKKRLKVTSQRKQILEVFLKVEKHLSVEDLYDLVKEKYPEIGFSTVYRTLRLFCESGLAIETHLLGDARVRFEHNYAHPHHDHLICVKCGTALEFHNPKVEQSLEKIAEEHSFVPQRHRVEIYGLCKSCRSKMK